MAHGDYHCCAICDCKMEYASGYSKTKEDICTACLKELRKQNLNILDGEEFLEWLTKENSQKVVEVLNELPYEFCYYSNPVDKKVKEIVYPLLTEE